MTEMRSKPLSAKKITGLNPQKIAAEWMVFKRASGPGDADGMEVEGHPVWGLLVNPNFPNEVITLTTDPTDGWVLLNGHRLWLDTVAWGLVDLCEDNPQQEGEHHA